MPWHTPITWAIGQLVTKLNLDEQIRDNMSFLKDELIVFFSGAVSNAGYDGDAVANGTYIMAANTFNAAIPTDARALIVSIKATFSSAADGKYVNMKNADDASTWGVVARAHDTMSNDAHGIVTLNASGEFRIVVAGGTTALYVQVWGYIR